MQVRACVRVSVASPLLSLQNLICVERVGLQSERKPLQEGASPQKVILSWQMPGCQRRRLAFI